MSAVLLGQAHDKKYLFLPKKSTYSCTNKYLGEDVDLLGDGGDLLGDGGYLLGDGFFKLRLKGVQLFFLKYLGKPSFVKKKIFCEITS